MFAEERRQLILSLLKENKRVDVSDLAIKLGTSPETIRRDLNEMEAEGFLKRTHGGAISLRNHTSRPLRTLTSRREINSDKKAAIAKVAAGMVDNGDVIAIDNSTTACRIIEFIPSELKITVITYSLQVMYEIAAKPNVHWTCISLGGIVNLSNMSAHGLLTTSSLDFFQPRKFFMSCAGISPDGLLTEGNLLEAEIKRELMKCSKETILLVDESKWGQTGAVNEGNVAAIEWLITNADVCPEKIAFLRDKKTKVLFDRETPDGKYSNSEAL